MRPVENALKDRRSLERENYGDRKKDDLSPIIHNIILSNNNQMTIFLISICERRLQSQIFLRGLYIMANFYIFIKNNCFFIKTETYKTFIEF